MHPIPPTTTTLIASDASPLTMLAMVVAGIVLMAVIEAGSLRRTRREGSQSLAVEVEAHAARQTRQNA